MAHEHAHPALSPEAAGRALAVLEKLQASNDLNEVLGAVIDAMRDGLRAERASVFQYDDANKELFIQQAHGMDAIRFPITKGIAGEAARTRGILNIRDCYADSRFNPEVDRKTGYRTRNMLTIPIQSGGGQLEGVAQVLNKVPQFGECFDAADEGLAKVLAAQAAIAIRRAKLFVAEARKNKIEHDLSIAKKIQQAGFPSALPSLAGYSLAACSHPAEETGGDAYDLFQPGITEANEQEGLTAPLLFALGDATGHGIGPALCAGQFRAMFRMGARLNADLQSIAREVNAQLCADLPMGRFVTAFLGRLDPKSHTIEYVSAGQAPLLLVRADGSVEMRDASAMPMGLDTEFGIDVVEPMRMGRGDVFLLISDGYFEALNRRNEHFGESGVVDAVKRAGTGADAAAIYAAISEAVGAFADGRPFDDDQTSIIIKRM